MGQLCTRKSEESVCGNDETLPNMLGLLWTLVCVCAEHNADTSITWVSMAKRAPANTSLVEPAAII